MSIKISPRLSYPLALSPKLEGVRGLIPKGKLVTSSWKKFPNRYHQIFWSSYMLKNLDGIFILGNLGAFDCYSKTNSALMTYTGKPKAKFWVFDDFTCPDLSFVDRLVIAEAKVNKAYGDGDGFNIEMLDQVLIESKDELLEQKEHYLGLGFRDVVLRDLYEKYKFEKY